MAIRPVITALLLAGACAYAAEPTVYEGFDYPVGHCESLNGGRGWDGAWAGGHNAIADDSLSSAIGQTPPAIGRHFVATNPDWASTRKLAQPIGTEAGTWYISLLIRNDKGITEENYGRALFAGPQGEVVAIGQEYFGNRWTIGGQAKKASQVPSNTTDPVFVVVKVTWDAPGAGKIEGFFDPELAQQPRIADVAADGLDLGAITTVSLVGKQAFSIDEIRIGAAWADVCPAPK